MAEISSDMPGTEEFENVDMKELGDSLPQQGRPGEEQSAKAVPAQEERQQATSESTGNVAKLEPQANDSTKMLEAKIATLESTITRMNRETSPRAFQALQSKLDKLEKALGARETSSPTLTPEQQVQADQRTEAEKFLKDFLAREVPGVLEEKYGHIVQDYESRAVERNQTQFKSSVEQICKDMNVPYEEMDKIFGKLLNADAAAYNEDPAAKARMDRILTTWDPNELFLRAMKERSAQMQAQGAQVQQRQVQAAAKGGRTFKANGAKPAQDTGKRTLEDIEQMSDEERDKLSLDELEAAVPRQRRR